MHVAIVGSGPAGLIAAETLAGAGLQVTVFEQHRSPGRKFLLAGRSGLNLTHSEPLDVLVGRYGPDRQWLEPAIRGFDSDALQRWCEGLGERVVIGSSGRVFPESFRATPLLRAWLARLDTLGVHFRFGHRWVGWAEGGALAFETGGTVVHEGFDAVLLAVGGASWPRVGGNGDWKRQLGEAGVEIEQLTAANCGVLVAWTPQMLASHEGSPVKNIGVSGDGGATTRRGDIVITKTGLEGGPIYAAARSLRSSSDKQLVIDLLPDLAIDAVLARLERRRKGATQTAWLGRAGLTPAAISLVRDATDNHIPDDASAASELVKQLIVRTEGLAPLDRAISTAGGVRFDQLDEQLMIIDLPGVFAAGEMLDWEAPTGGYLLQACFSTGVAAANGIVGHL